MLQSFRGNYGKVATPLRGQGYFPVVPFGKVHFQLPSYGVNCTYPLLNPPRSPRLRVKPPLLCETFPFAVYCPPRHAGDVSAQGKGTRLYAMKRKSRSVPLRLDLFSLQICYQGLCTCSRSSKFVSRFFDLSNSRLVVPVGLK